MEAEGGTILTLMYVLHDGLLAMDTDDPSKLLALPHRSEGRWARVVCKAPAHESRHPRSIRTAGWSKIEAGLYAQTRRLLSTDLLGGPVCESDGQHVALDRREPR